MPTVPITVAYGDGIGPEIMEATLHILKEAGAKLQIEKIDIGEKVYLAGNSSGIDPSAWDSLRNTRVFLKAPITTPQGGGYKSLNVTTLVCANRLYRILQMEAARAGAVELARNARMLTELAPPELGWVELARGFGVPGARVTTADALVTELRTALSAAGPRLIEMVL